MSQSLNRGWLLLLLVIASPAFALGLGEIRLESALNQPLRAEIELISATPEELQNLEVALASSDTFARYGIDRPFYLTRMNFRLVRSGRATGNVVEITSPDPITEPFLTFLVEATWSSGRLLREYTVLLDPPTFAPPSPGPQEIVQAPARSAPADSGRIERSQPAPAPAPAPAPSQPAPVASQPSAPAPASPAPAPFDTSPGGIYEVQRGDTLWGIASQARTDNRLTMNQLMLAIFEANPDAFDGNINQLSAGATLRIPSADEVFRINRGDALSEVQRQNNAWLGAGPESGPAVTPQPAEQPSLTLVPPDDDTLTQDGSTTYEGIDSEVPADEVSEPLSITDIRVEEIEDLLADQQNGLVVISDNELAALRRELAELRGEPIPDDLIDAATDPIDDVLPEEDPVFADDVDDAVVADDTSVAGDPIEEPVAEEPAPAPPVSAPTAQPSFIDRALGLLSNTWVLIGAALAIVAALLLWFVRRASGGSAEEEATGLWEALDEDAGSETQQSTERLSAMAREDDTAIVVVEQSETGSTSTMEVPPQDVGDFAGDALAGTGTQQAIEDTFSSETALNLDQSDPIAEADFHMAYGLYDQAADLVNGALAVDPSRKDLMAKLCEIYFVWGNRDAFVDAAERLQSALAGAEDPEWDKIVIMGQQIAADHALFSGASAAGATKAVDLSFEGGTAEVGALDMDLASSGDEADVIDLGAASQSVEAADAGAVDFDFDDDAEDTANREAAGDFAEAFDADTVEGPTIESPTTEVTAEMPTVETPVGGIDDTAESPTIEQQLAGIDEHEETTRLDDEEVTAVAPVDEARTADATAELDLDDLGLDLDDMQSSLNDDLADDALDDTSRSAALDLDVDDPEATGRNEVLDEDATGTHDVAAAATGLHAVADLEQTLAETGEMPSLDISETGEVEFDSSLLDATGQTQILPDDFAVETGTGTNIERALADDEATLMAPSPFAGGDNIADDAETLLAPLDDDASPGDFDFAKTEALPDEAYAGSTDATGEMPAVPGSTDMDLDLDDLTAALKLSAAGDTVNQVRDDATVEQPRPPAARAEIEPTAEISPEQLSEDLHDARTMTEVGTKLDLARAYVDMGDPGGARSILEEVLDEGDESQRQQARHLLESLPG